MRRRRLRIAALALGVVVLVLFLVSFLIDEPLRRHVESGVNAQLVGYTARIGKLRFHPIGGSIDILDATLAQNANPDPPVASIPRLHASLHWRALLHLRLVADFWFDRPVLNIDLRQAKQETQDKVPLHQRGWQEAAAEIFPFKIDLLRISNGDFTYTDRGPYKPLHVSLINLRAENIRNVRSRDREYPSEVHADALVFDQAPLRVDGRADFLAEPHAGIHTYTSLHAIPLAYFTPLLERYGSIRKGMLSIDGDVEYAPRVKSLDLDALLIEGVDADYVRTAENAAEEKQATQKAVEKTKEVSNHPGVQLRARDLRVVRSTLGFVNRQSDPPYRIFLADTDLTIDRFTNQRTEGVSTAALRAKFMSSGDLTARASFRPQTKDPNFDVNVRIENTDLRTMNDLLRANGNFDVAGGTFSYYSELAVRQGRVTGYAKPMFKDVKVYEETQDRDKPAMQRVYERVVGGVAAVLENRQQGEVATKTDLSGPLENPQTSTWQIVVRLIQNAFFKAILPGLEGRLRLTRGEPTPPEPPPG